MIKSTHHFINNEYITKYMEILAKELSEKTVVNDNGSVIGELHNITLDYESGSLNSLIVSPNEQESSTPQNNGYRVSDDGYYVIPAETVTSVKDQLVISS